MRPTFSYLVPERLFESSKPEGSVLLKDSHWRIDYLETNKQCLYDNLAMPVRAGVMLKGPVSYTS